MVDEASAAAAGVALDAQHPWPGLASFTEDASGYFHGRGDEVAELSRRVQRKLLTVLFGQSGLGKTSMLSAGVVPRLRPEGYCPVYVRVDYGPEAPSAAEQIKLAVLRATGAAGTWTRPGAAAQGESLWEFLHHRDDELRDASGRPVVPLLIFDQFEEIFTLAQADAAGRRRAAGFLEDLADLVENRPPKTLEAKLETDEGLAERFDFSRAAYRVLIALREDYLAHLEGLKAAMPSITQNRMRLARMTGAQALEAVLGPGGALVTREVAESIVRFVAGGAELRNAEVEPSLLSLVCRELNNARLAQGRDTISIDLLAGSNATILSDFYERALADQPAAVRRFVEDDLLTESGYRENVAEERVLKALAAAGATPDAPAALATLVNRRLLRIEERLDVRRVELTHDVLCAVVKASRAERREREARQEAERKLAAQREHERATRRALVRARQVAAGCAVLALVAIASAAYGIYSANRAARAEAVSQRSRDEAERLVGFILDDFYAEVEPVGRTEVLGGLARRAVEYYEGLPPEARDASTRRNGAVARAQYGQVLLALGRLEEGDRYLDAAIAEIKALRAAGDGSDATLVAQARILLRDASRVIGRRLDVEGSASRALEGLAILQPVLARGEAPRSARLLQADLLRAAGFAQLRSGSRDRASSMTNLRRAVDVYRAAGSSDAYDVGEAFGHASALVWLGDAMASTDAAMERRPVLEEGLAILEGLLQRRPGHRPALRLQGTAHRLLGEFELETLQGARALGHFVESVAANQQALELDGGLGSRNNLRLVSLALGESRYAMGRADEGNKALELALEVGEDESLDAFNAANLLRNTSLVALLEAEQGNDQRARELLRRADGYYAKSQTEGRRIGLRPTGVAGAISKFRALVVLGDRAELAEAVDALDRLWADPQRRGSLADSILWDLRFSVSYSLASGLARLTLGELAAAEVQARRALAESQRMGTFTMGQRREDQQIRALLATVLARQGKLAEASATIQPAVAFFREPVVRASDIGILKAEHARVLQAAALATADPARRREYLLEAARQLDAMPATLRRFRSNVALRAEISRQLAG